MDSDQQSTLTTIFSMSQLEETELSAPTKQLLLESLAAASEQTRVSSLQKISWMCFNYLFSITQQQLDNAVHQYDRMGVHNKNSSTLGGVSRPSAGKVIWRQYRISTLPPSETCVKLINLLQHHERQQKRGLQVFKDAFFMLDKLAIEQSQGQIKKDAEEEVKEIKEAALSEAEEIIGDAKRRAEVQGKKKAEEIAQLADSIKLLKGQRLQAKRQMEQSDKAFDELLESSVNLSIQMSELMIGEKEKRE